MQGINFIFSIVVLIMSAVLHEISHGYAAYALGDNTAKNAGRLSLNPFKHLDIYGSFIIPVLTYLLGGFIFGWAKPVPYNQYNLRNQKWGPAILAVAGPASNFIVAIAFGLFLRYSGAFAFLPASFFQLVILIIFINLILGVFNLVPIPPLDGSKILFSIFPQRWQTAELALERYGFIILIIFIFGFSQILIPIVSFLFKTITGLTF
jgi:Zn-dependent protease